MSLAGVMATDRRRALTRASGASPRSSSASPKRTVCVSRSRVTASRSSIPAGGFARRLASGRPGISSTNGMRISGSEKTESSATMSARPSWRAAWSGEDGSVNPSRSPSRRAWVVSWTTMSCDSPKNVGARRERT